MVVVKVDRNPRSGFDVLGRSPELRAFWDSCGDPFAASVATDGLSLQFVSSPPLGPAPDCSASRVPEKREALRDQVAAMESLGVVSRIPLSSVGFWGHIFVVPKKGGSWRLILDLSPLNVFVVHETFQMVSLQDVFSAVRQSDWMASLDIEKAYWHVPVPLCSGSSSNSGSRTGVFSFV